MQASMYGTCMCMLACLNACVLCLCVSLHVCVCIHACELVWVWVCVEV